MRARVAWVGLGCVLALSAGGSSLLDLGLSRGAAPVDEPFVSAQRCGTCHVAQYEQWKTSRHAAAHSNPLYEHGFIDEPLDFCTHCHSPLAEQVAEVQANADWYRARRHTDAPLVERHPEEAASEGITCAVCHVRDGQIVFHRDSPGSPHDIRVEPAFNTAELCQNCHQFEMFTAGPGGVQSTGELMQSTYDEWLAWGGRSSCQDCHMPEGAHIFRGAHDREWLKQSVQVRQRGDRLRLRTRGVGHHLPTGDLFRRITVQADAGEGFVLLATYGKQWALVEESGVPIKRLVGDTTLAPDVWAEVSLPTGWQRWRVRYHYGSTGDEARQILPADQLVFTLDEGARR